MHIPEAILHQLCTYVTVLVSIMNKDMLIVFLNIFDNGPFLVMFIYLRSI